MIERFKVLFVIHCNLQTYNFFPPNMLIFNCFKNFHDLIEKILCFTVNFLLSQKLFNGLGCDFSSFRLGDTFLAKYLILGRFQTVFLFLLIKLEIKRGNGIVMLFKPLQINFPLCFNTLRQNMAQH